MPAEGALPTGPSARTELGAPDHQEVGGVLEEVLAAQVDRVGTVAAGEGRDDLDVVPLGPRERPGLRTELEGAASGRPRRRQPYPGEEEVRVGRHRCVQRRQVVGGACHQGGDAVAATSSPSHHLALLVRVPLLWGGSLLFRPTGDPERVLVGESDDVDPTGREALFESYLESGLLAHIETVASLACGTALVGAAFALRRAERIRRGQLVALLVAYAATRDHA